MLRSGPLFATCCVLGLLVSPGCGDDPAGPLLIDNPTEPIPEGDGLDTSRLPFVEDFEPTTGIQGSRIALHVRGENFDVGSRVDLLVSGNAIADVQTHSTQFVTPEELVADISIGPHAPVGTYQVQVTTSGGKRGIPIEDFTVVFNESDAVELEFTSEPGPELSALNFSSPIQVAARNPGGQIDTSFRGIVTITLMAHPSGGSLTGGTSVQAVRGVATFPEDLRIDLPARGYALVATATGLRSATSAAFDVRPAGRIAFVSDRDGTPKIYVMNADGSGVTRVTDGQDADSRPAWSPDGHRIAFARNGYDRRNGRWSAEDNGACGIYVISADGSGLTRLTTSCADGAPTWSPDGTRIAFSKWDGDPESPGNGIYVMNANGSGVARLTELTEVGMDDYPTWSPDGQRIAFNRSLDLDGEMPHQVYVINADGSGIHRLTLGDNFAEGGPSWSPDGSSIVFWSFGYGIATVNSNGGLPSTVYRGVVSDFVVHFYSTPDWSPDGRKIVFAREQTSSSWQQRRLFIRDASGTGPLQAITTPTWAWDDFEPAWSRAGQ